jgi:hypothetical protein
VTAGPEAGGRTVADRMGIGPGTLLQQLGDDDDIDDGLLPELLAKAGTELTEDDSDEVVDVVLLWWREDDGDLVDALMDARTRLDADGTIWLLTPKAGRDRHVEPSDILSAAPTAGLVQTSTLAVSQDWSGSRLVSRKTERAGKQHR